MLTRSDLSFVIAFQTSNDVNKIIVCVTLVFLVRAVVSSELIMNRLLPIIGAVVLACSSVLSQQNAARVPSVAKGMVRTVRIESQQILALTYYQEGVMVDTIIYDSNGRVLESADYQAGSTPDTKHTSVYDERGNEIEIAYYIHGSITHRRHYKYDRMNRKIEELDLDPNGTQRGRSIFRYPKPGMQIRQEVRPDGSRWKSSITTFDNRGKVLKLTNYEQDGAVKGKTIYTYDVRGNILSETNTYKSDGRSKSSKQSYNYNDSGFLLEESQYFDGVLNDKTTYKRDPHGNATDVVKFDNKLRMTEKQSWTFEFASGDDWVRAVLSEWTSKKPNEPLQPTFEIRRIFRIVSEATFALWSAADEGDIARVEKLLRDGADVNVGHPDGGTALIKAAGNGHLKVVQTLLTASAKVDARDGDGWTALMWSAEFGWIEIVTLLLANGADPNSKNDVGGVAIMPTALNGHVEVLKLLLEKGADINVVASDGSTALMVAAQEGKVELVRFLLSHGANKNMKTSSGKTALFFGSRSHSTDTVRLLLESGLDVNARDNNGTTPLMMAAFNFDTDVLKFLILSGADVNAQDNDGKTALDETKRINNEKAIEALKKAGAK